MLLRLLHLHETTNRWFQEIPASGCPRTEKSWGDRGFALDFFIRQLLARVLGCERVPKTRCCPLGCRALALRRRVASASSRRGGEAQRNDAQPPSKSWSLAVLFLGPEQERGSDQDLEEVMGSISRGGGPLSPIVAFAA